MEAERKETSASIGLLILRIGTGGYLITHGWGKLQMLLAGGAEKFGDPVGLGSTLSLALVTTSEFLCAVLIIIGLATRLAAVPVVISMAVAAFVIHARDPWTMEAAAKAFFGGASKTWFSKEPALLYLIPFLSLVFTGGGKLSLDRLIAIRGNRHQATEQRRFERTEKRRAA
ncbi:MAG: DoxX family protein [Desulfobacteria bacterium]